MSFSLHIQGCQKPVQRKQFLFTTEFLQSRYFWRCFQRQKQKAAAVWVTHMKINLAEEWILQHITSTVIPEMSDLTDDYNLNQNIAGFIQEK